MIFFNNLLAIFRKELESYLFSPFFYIIAGCFWLIAGFFFIYVLGHLTEEVAQVDHQGVLTSGIDLATQFLNSYFNLLISLLLVILPALSMGLYAEERKRGTLELLATSPITNTLIALGKLLGVIAIFLILWSPVVLYQSIAFSASQPAFSLSVLLLANVGLILFAGAVLSLGMWISSLSEHSILAYILTFVLIIVLWSIDLISANTGEMIGDFLSYISLFKNSEPFFQGILQSESIVLLLSYIVAGVFLTTQSVELLKK